MELTMMLYKCKSVINSIIISIMCVIYTKTVRKS